MNTVSYLKTVEGKEHDGEAFQIKNFDGPNGKRKNSNEARNKSPYDAKTSPGKRRNLMKFGGKDKLKLK